MATVKETAIARLQTELTTVEASIKNIIETGQGFRKGGSMGFSVQQSKLSDLRKERSEIRAKLALWGVYDG